MVTFSLYAHFLESGGKKRPVVAESEKTVFRGKKMKHTYSIGYSFLHSLHSNV